MENISGLINLSMMANGKKIKLMGSATMNGQMAELSKVNGKITTCTARVYTHGKMAESMMVIT
jgi:hypothetical protein